MHKIKYNGGSLDKNGQFKKSPYSVQKATKDSFEWFKKNIGKVERHDMNWSTEISMLISDGDDIESDEVKQAALNYWNGKPHYNESVWEYLTPRAEILSVEEY